MPSKILLISSNRCTTPDPVFPLGVAHLHAALRRAGHEVSWYDSFVREDRLEGVLEQFRPDFVGISLRNIDDVLIRKQETFFDAAASLGARIRRKTNCPVVMGGSGYSIFPEQLLDLSGADYGICGEGEAALVTLIAALESGSDFSEIPGLVFRRGSKIVTRPPSSASFERELTEADWPDATIAPYLQATGTLNLQTQRGCAFRCCYCTYPLIEGRRHRRFAAESVAAEFELLQHRGARYIFIVDSVFNSSPGHVTEVCEALLRRNVKMAWGCFLRPQGLTPELMRLMARAGLAHIEFGSDSFCDEVLSAYQKDFCFNDILVCSELARSAGIDCCHFLICGGPGETHETLRRGFENSKRLAGAVIIAVVGMRIYPGTELFSRAMAEGRIERQTNLLTPAYYMAPGLTEEDVFAQLQEFAGRSPNWIVGDPGPAYQSLVNRLRRRGVIGPLWSYFSMLQRLWPLGAGGGLHA